MLKNIARHSAIYAAGDLLTKALAFLLIPLYTHYLQPAEYGSLELLELSSYVVGFFLAMGVSQALTRYYHDAEGEADRALLVGTSRWLVVGICIIAWPILMVASPHISQLVFEQPDFANPFRIVFSSLLIQLIGEVGNTLLRIQERSITYVCISFVRVAISLGLNIYFVSVLRLGISGILWSGLTAAITSTSLLIFVTRHGTSRKFSRHFAARLIKFGVPLIASWAGMFVLNFSDRFFLQRLSTLDEVGIYSLAYKFGLIPNMLIVAPFMLYWSTKRFELAKEDFAGTLFARVFTYLIAACLFTSIGIAMLAPEIFAVVADERYQSGASYVTPVLCAYIFNAAYSYEQFGLLQAKKTRRLAVISVIVATVNILLNLQLIPPLGAWGASLSTLCSFALLFIITHWNSRRHYPTPYEYQRIGKLLVIALLLYFGEQTLTLDYIWGSVVLKVVAFLLTLPCLLYVFGFANEQERDFLRLRFFSNKP